MSKVKASRVCEVLARGRSFEILGITGHAFPGKVLSTIPESLHSAPLALCFIHFIPQLQISFFSASSFSGPVSLISYSS